MGFLQPLLLALGAAVAVPLVLHLFQRQQGPRVVFPALRYLRRAEKENARRIRLRQLLLLALRVAAVVLLAVAAARPFIAWGGDEHKPTAAVIIMDNSLSTGLVSGDRRVLDILKERALETLAMAGPDDRFWLIRAATPWAPALPGGAAETAVRVRETDVAGSSADLLVALDRARSLLAAAAGDRSAEIHLLTDLQANGITGNLPARGMGGPPVLVWAPEGGFPHNTAVHEVRIGGGLPPLSNIRSSVSARISGTAGDDTADVRLIVDGRVTGAASTPVDATAVLPFPARAAGLITGWVETDPDALRGDDHHYFVTHVREPPTVALAEATPFIEEALGVLADAGRIRRAEPDASAVDVVIAPAARGADAVRSGEAVILLPPASPLALPATNRRLAEAGIPWRFQAVDAAGEARIAPEDVPDHDLPALSSIRIRTAYRLVRQRPAADSVRLRLRGGSPWLVGGSLPDGGEYVLLGTPLTEEMSTIPTSSAMLPLLDRLIARAATADAVSRGKQPGEYLALPAAADSVVRPDGRRDAVTGADGYRVPQQPGIYRVMADGAVISAFAVNPPAEESELVRMEPGHLTVALPGWDANLIRDPDAWGDAVYIERLGREAWRPLVLIALAILLIEGLIATSGRGRSGGKSSGEAPPQTAATGKRTRPSGRPRQPAAAGPVSGGELR